MKTLTVLETAEEVLHAADRSRSPVDDFPLLPADAMLAFYLGSADAPSIDLLNAPDFKLSHSVHHDAVIIALCERAGIGGQVST